MATLEVSPLFRSNSVGIERPWSGWQTALSLENSGDPAYNILKLDDDDFRISLAVPGFSQSEIVVESHDRTLWVKGEQGTDPHHNQYLYQGIGLRGFQRSFQLPEHVKVRSARLEAGLLHIDLERELPEALRPRRIEVETGGEVPHVIEDRSKAA